MNQNSPLSEIPIQDLLLYSPYDNRYSFRHKLTIKDFKDIRILPQLYLDEKENLKRIINSNGNYFQSFYILSGYSGNGKTTFLNWFKEEIEDENYVFEIIDLIYEGHGKKDDFTLLEECLKDKLVSGLLDKKALKIISEYQNVFMRYFSKLQLGAICNNYQENNLDEPSIYYLLEEFDFTQLLILFLLQNILNFIEDEDLKNKKSYTFCFDNLDELKFEYLTPKMWSEILDVSSKMNRVIQDIKLDFDFSKRIVFVLVFREANIACGTAQLNERLSAIKSVKRFIYTNIGREIIEQRVRVAAKYLNDEDVRLRDLLKILYKEKTTEEILLPLFNYDYRKLLEATVSIIKPENIGGKVYRQFNLYENGYKAFSHKFTYGKRGILFNSYLKFLAINNFLGKLAPVRTLDKKISHCNESRLILTVFSNLSFPDGFPKDKKELAEIKPNEFSLIKAYKACEEFISIPDFFNKVSALIDINKSSWAHLLTIYGKVPERDGDLYWFNFGEEQNLLLKYFSNNDLTEEESTKLNNISFSLNASAYIYLRHILTHFEYISAYKTRNNGELWYSFKPLFQLTGIIVGDVPQWEFQNKLINVYKHVETYFENIENYFKNEFVKRLGYTRESYCCSNYVFKGEYEKSYERGKDNISSFYITRLLTTHIRYIETFRHYITGEGFKVLESNMAKNVESLVQNIHLKTKDRIHVFLLGYIEKYLDLLDKTKDPTLGKVIIELKGLLESAKKDHAIWIERKTPTHNKMYM